MNDRQKYINLKYGLINIENKINELLSSYDSLNGSIKQNLSINSEQPEYGSINESKSQLSSINNEIKTKLIPNINTKIR